MNLFFKKTERIKSRKALEILLRKGSVHFLFPLRVVWMFTDFPIESEAQVAFAVPKKRFKRANQRNLIKRRMREAYRLNKYDFYQKISNNGLHVQMLIVYIAPEVLTYLEIERKIKATFEHIVANIKKTD
jgi:ribonuclease P protein component